VSDSVKTSAARSRSVKVGRLRPDSQAVQALLGLADCARVLGVHVDAGGATVELRGTDAHQLAKALVEANVIELFCGCLVEVVHRAFERNRVLLELQSDRNFWGAVCVCVRHAIEPMPVATQR
jgi:hypothetical protein